MTVKPFDQFMWLKVTGRLDNMRIGHLGDAHLPAETYFNYQRNMKILKEHGVEYPNWKEAKEVLKQYS